MRIAAVALTGVCLACGETEAETDTDTSTSGEETTGTEVTSGTGENAAPQPLPDFYPARADVEQTVAAADGVLANDGDPDGDSLAVVDPPVMSTHGGTLALAEDGGFSYTSANGYCGHDLFEYAASDAQAQATASATVTVHPPTHTVAQLASDCGGFTIVGAALGDHAGEVVTGVGDFNGDGLGDVAVASPVAHVVHIVFGSRAPVSVDLGSLGSAAGIAINFDPGLDRRNLALAPAGDFNGDGLADLAIAMPEVQTMVEGGGRVWVVFGRSEAGPQSLASLVGDGAGVEISGALVDTRLGSGIDRAGDQNGDGRDDLLIGAKLNGPMMSGTAHVIFGQPEAASLTLMAMGDGVNGQSFHTGEPGASLGWSVAGGKDVNGDGLPDMVIGAPSSEANGPNAGRAYVVFGNPGHTGLSVEDLAGPEVKGFAIAGEAESDAAGYRVALVEDLNGDNLAEVLVGAPFTAEQGWGTGSAYLVFGQQTATPVELADIAAGVGGWKITGEGAQAFAGEFLAGVDDLTGDGLPEVIIGAYGSEPTGFESGRVYLVAGQPGASEPLAFADLQQQLGGQALAGPIEGSRMGNSVADAGDVNGDGVGDLIVGAPQVGVEPFGGGPPENVGRGVAYVVLGGPSL